MRGCVIKRGNKWALVIELARDHVTGKRRRQWYTVEGTKKEAERRLRAELLKVETGAYVKPVNITLGEYLNSWLDEYVETQTRPSTADGYRDIINSHLIPELEGIRLTALEPSHIQTYYTRMVQSGRRDGEGGLSAMTIKHHHAILRKALKCAVESGIVGRNVAEAVKPPRVDQTKQKALAPDDVKRMLDAAKETPIYALLFTALYTGCRRGELLGLRWEDVHLNDVNLEESTLSVVRTLQHIPSHGYVFGAPKSEASSRTIALSGSVARVLRDHKLNTLYTLGYLPKGDDLVFSTIEGKPLPPNGVTKAVHDLAALLGLRGIHFHSLRHSHASLCLRQGIHPKIVQERLGHSSIRITLDTYSHVDEDIHRAAAKRFGEGLENTLENTEKPAVGLQVGLQVDRGDGGN